jgi:SAM-dependent methyltransferase
LKIGLIPENLLERAALALGKVPTPFGETHPPLLLARAVMAATKQGLFEALAAGPLSAPEVAERRGTHPGATRAFLDALVSSGYLELAGERYALTPPARKWLLKDSPRSLYDNILYRYLEWGWLARMDDYLTSGMPLDMHSGMTPEEWGLYQRGMLSLARLMAPELVWRTRLPRGARDLLDLGGSHGYFSVALCRRHPDLRAVVLDLPEAIEQSAPLLAREGMGERVVHRAGNALKDDLGEGSWDAVLLSQLAHHFDDATNRDLIRRIARALRPGGLLVILEVIRRESPREGGQMGGLFDLYFALTSEAGTWTFAEMATWQRDAGLRPRKPIRFRTAPGMGLQTATKPG